MIEESIHQSTCCRFKRNDLVIEALFDFWQWQKRIPNRCVVFSFIEGQISFGNIASNFGNLSQEFLSVEIPVQFGQISFGILESLIDSCYPIGKSPLASNFQFQWSR
ncbi:hypothetical protein VNO77_21975 [Canavalia gladiata]|uniref:Uncharacterized protein n=1 Tax=Canavalia gladiata TaxID=3824 RepID=A0AAN9L1X3_CANGL